MFESVSLAQGVTLREGSRIKVGTAAPEALAAKDSMVGVNGSSSGTKSGAPGSYGVKPVDLSGGTADVRAMGRAAFTGFMQSAARESEARAARVAAGVDSEHY